MIVDAIARSPIQRLVAFNQERGWRDLKICGDVSGDYTRDYSGFHMSMGKIRLLKCLKNLDLIAHGQMKTAIS